MHLDLPLIWAGVLALSVIMYVILDGFDLGIGILFPFAQEDERDVMMNTVAPFWDGNETWLVLGGGGLWIAFPQAYAVLLPALYLPVIGMLLALVFRGVAFEFRWIAQGSRPHWNFAFAAGAALAAFFQGVILGGIVHGVEVRDGQYAGGAFDWLTPFNLLCGLAVVTGYALLGATWLVMKTEGVIAARARRQAKLLLLLVLAFMAAVSLWTPLSSERIAERWFSWPNLLYLSPVPIVTAAIALLIWRALERGSEVTPFLGAIGLFLLGFLGLAISTFPYVIPPRLTIWQASAAPSTQAFMLVGVAVLLPIVLAYTAFVYWIFRGKIRPGEGYH